MIAEAQAVLEGEMTWPSFLSMLGIGEAEGWDHMPAELHPDYEEPSLSWEELRDMDKLFK